MKVCIIAVTKNILKVNIFFTTEYKKAIVSSLAFFNVTSCVTFVLGSRIAICFHKYWQSREMFEVSVRYIAYSDFHITCDMYTMKYHTSYIYVIICVNIKLFYKEEQ